MGEASVIGPRPIAPLSAADIKDEIWLEIGRYNAEAPPRRQAAQQQVQAAPQPVTGPLALPALLALDGAAFIRAAYQTVLERAPDEAGIAHFTRQMEAGVSKIVLLGGLQRSAEGRQSGRAVAGLRRRYMAQRLYGVPVVGPGVRLAGFVLRQGGMSGHLGGTVRASRQQVQAALLDRVNASQEALERRARVQDAAIDALARRLEIIQVQHAESAAGLQKTLAEQARRIGLQESAGERSLANAATQGRSLSALASQSLAMGRRLGEMEDSSMESLLAMSDALDQQKLRLSQIEATLQAEAAQDVAMEDGVPGLRQSQAVRLARAEALLVQNREAMIEQERRVGVLVEALRTRSEALPVAVQQQDDHAVDSLYVEFEDRFRGTRADIKDRLRFYLPILAESGAGAPDRPVLDVGCGRGEFLELLREEGLSASGVDANAAMAESCRSLGLDCEAGDALAHLAALPAGSLGAVTGFHIIEHLPFKTMVRLFDAALLALAPGGLVVFETPNPANLLVASRWFYLDPTHRNPLPGEMVAMIAEARGFTGVSIVDLHPMAQRFGGQDAVLREQLDQIFHGPQDYALLARKP